MTVKTVWKLTDRNGQTHNDTQWGEGVTHTASGKGDLCGPGWLHYYHDPLLAVLLQPLHVSFGRDTQLWECHAEGEHKDDRGLKGGCTKLTSLRRVDLPEVTNEQRVRFAIYCAEATGESYPGWSAWAEKWLSGEDRTSVAVDARAVAAARRTAAGAVCAACAADAARAADAVCAACAADAARAVAVAVAVAAAARRTAAWAACAADEACGARVATDDIDLADLARRAVNDEVAK